MLHTAPSFVMPPGTAASAGAGVGGGGGGGGFLPSVPSFMFGPGGMPVAVNPAMMGMGAPTVASQGAGAGVAGGGGMVGGSMFPPTPAHTVLCRRGWRDGGSCEHDGYSWWDWYGGTGHGRSTTTHVPSSWSLVLLYVDATFNAATPSPGQWTVCGRGEWTSWYPASVNAQPGSAKTRIKHAGSRGWLHGWWREWRANGFRCDGANDAVNYRHGQQCGEWKIAPEPRAKSRRTT